MASESIGMVIALGAISVLFGVAVYAVSEFLRNALSARKHRAMTIARYRHFPARPRWEEGPIRNTGTSTRRKPLMQHHYQNLQAAQVRDLVTGLEGIVTAVMYCMNGCVRVCVQPTAKDNKPATDIEWCDVQQVERIGSGVRAEVGLEPDAHTDGQPPADYPRTAAVGGPHKSSPRPV